MIERINPKKKKGYWQNFFAVVYSIELILLFLLFLWFSLGESFSISSIIGFHQIHVTSLNLAFLFWEKTNLSLISFATTTKNDLKFCIMQGTNSYYCKNSYRLKIQDMEMATLRQIMLMSLWRVCAAKRRALSNWNAPKDFLVGYGVNSLASDSERGKLIRVEDGRVCLSFRLQCETLLYQFTSTFGVDFRLFFSSLPAYFHFPWQSTCVYSMCQRACQFH